ncbi:MAG TPA: MlaD family protein [Vicinamibacterales bacterium]|nr:MlaD family protein [Vicinamibacterales bacterium]
MTSRLAAVGVFVLAALALFAFGLFMIGERRGLFEPHFEVYAEFERIAGLENGATVRVAGMDAGEVVEIRVPTGPRGRFRVRARISERLHAVVRADSVASIQTEGLLGAKFLQIEAGSERAPAAPSGSTIRSREPFEIADLLQQMSTTVARVDETIGVLRGDVERVLAAVGDTTAEARDVIEDVGDDIRRIAGDAGRVTADVCALVEGVRAGRGTVGRLFADDALYARAERIAAEAERAVAGMRRATDEAQDLLARLQRGEPGGAGLVDDLRHTLATARDAMADLAESTEALKHNFLLRGFFTRRGYFDLDDLSAADYRRGVLETGGRRALRIWIAADVLFTGGPDGTTTLADAGRARLDSAMSTFVRYLDGGPLVVEGYATAPTEAEQYRASLQRARAVREYLIDRFSLDPRHVGAVPLGADAPGSPAGGRWDGVALALFVDRARVDTIR